MFMWKHLNEFEVCFIYQYTCMLIVVLILAARGDYTANRTMSQFKGRNLNIFYKL